MPVLQQTPVISYTANGSVTTFAYPFQVLLSTDLLVYVNGTLQTSGYSATGVGNAGGGNVVFVSAPANTAIVRIVRSTVISRTTDYIEGGAVPAATLDGDFDRAIMIMQEYNALALRENTAGFIDAANRKIVNLVDPTNLTDAVTKNYVDNTMSGSVLAASNSASSASSSATTASSWATAASISSASSATYANNSLTYSNNASTSATNAATSASNAAASAAAATHPWVVSGSDTYFTTGNVGVGTSTISGRFHSADTGSQHAGVFSALGGTGVYINGKSGTTAQSDVYISRTSTSDSVVQGPNIYFDGNVANTQWSIQAGSTGLLFHGYYGGWGERFKFGTQATLSVNGVAGTAGQVLTSNGPSTAVTWSSPETSQYLAVATPPNPSGGFILRMVAHGMGVVPASVGIEIVCTTSEFGFGVGTVVQPFLTNGASSYIPNTLYKDVNNVYCPIPSGYAFGVLRADNGAGQLITTANWTTRFVVRKT